MLRMPAFSRDEWNVVDVILSNAKSISQVHLLLLFFHCLPDYAKRLWDVFMTPELTKEYIPNLVKRGGFSIFIKCQVVSEKIVSLPHRQMGYLGCT